MEQDLTFGEVINGTIQTVNANRNAALIYLVVFTIVGSSIQLLALQLPSALTAENNVLGNLQFFAGMGAGFAGIAIFVLEVIGQYLLWDAMLGSSSVWLGDEKRRYLAFFGLLLLTGIGTAFGFALLVFPGLIAAARWSMAPALLIRERQGVIEAMGNSWYGIKGNTTPIALAILVWMIGLIAVSAMLGAATVDGGDLISMVGTIFEQLLSSCGTVAAISLGVFLFRRLDGGGREVAEVFS